VAKRAYSGGTGHTLVFASTKVNALGNDARPRISLSLRWWQQESPVPDADVVDSDMTSNDLDAEADAP
jgi:hypothetical protein